MSIEAVHLTFDFFKDQLAVGSLRWNKEVADRFAKLLGSGYVKESIRSLWPLYPDDQRVMVGYLLETAEQWRTYLRKGQEPDGSVNDKFARVSQLLLESLEGTRELPASSLFVIEDGHLKMAGAAAEVPAT